MNRNALIAIRSCTRRLGVLAGVIAAAASLETNAVSFVGLNANEADVSGQLNMTVSDPGSGKVLFTIQNLNNAGALGVFIGDIWFDTTSGADDNVLGTFDALIEQAGVDYKQKTSGAFPEGNNASPSFAENQGLHFTKNGGASNAINKGEQLGIRVNLAAGKTVTDVLAALDNGSIRVGLHLQGYASGGSDSYINGTPPSVPDAGSTLALLGLGLVGIGMARRKLQA